MLAQPNVDASIAAGLTTISYLSCMLRAVVLFGLWCSLSPVFGQQDHASPQDTMPYLEVMPQFPGGEEAMGTFLREGAEYPREALKAGVSGKVWVQFVVRKDGEVDSVHVFRGVHPALDAEAERVVRSMPPWKPATMMGRPVAVKFTVPIVFSIEDTGRERKAARKARREQRRK